MDFPNLPAYTLALARMDRGIELVAMMALAAVVWLWLARFSWPQMLPALRVASFVAFYLSLIVFAIGVVR
jgi:hypothetical protein